jgi:hypothetical protein
MVELGLRAAELVEGRSDLAAGRLRHTLAGELSVMVETCQASNIPCSLTGWRSQVRGARPGRAPMGRASDRAAPRALAATPNELGRGEHPEQ